MSDGWCSDMGGEGAGEQALVLRDTKDENMLERTSLSGAMVRGATRGRIGSGQRRGKSSHGRSDYINGEARAVGAAGAGRNEIGRAHV